jgi:hypothetical protein
LIGNILGLPPGRYVVEVRGYGRSITSREVDVVVRAVATICLD